MNANKCISDDGHQMMTKYLLEKMSKKCLLVITFLIKIYFVLLMNTNMNTNMTQCVNQAFLSVIFPSKNDARYFFKNRDLTGYFVIF